MNVVKLKACYVEGEDICGGEEGWSDYTATPAELINVTESLLWEVRLSFKRINVEGYGVSRVRDPAVRVYEETGCGDDAIPLEHSVLPPSAEEIPVVIRFILNLTVEDNQKIRLVSAELRHDGNILTGGTCGSSQNYRYAIYGDEWDWDDGIYIFGINGLMTAAAINKILSATKQYMNDDSAPAAWFDIDVFRMGNFARAADGAVFASNVHVRNKQANLAALVAEAGDAWESLTWRQIQYALLQTEAPYLVTDEEADAWFRENECTAIINRY